MATPEVSKAKSKSVYFNKSVSVQDLDPSPITRNDRSVSMFSAMDIAPTMVMEASMDLTSMWSLAPTTTPQAGQGQSKKSIDFGDGVTAKRTRQSRADSVASSGGGVTREATMASGMDLAMSIYDMTPEFSAVKPEFSAAKDVQADKLAALRATVDQHAQVPQPELESNYSAGSQERLEQVKASVDAELDDAAWHAQQDKLEKLREGLEKAAEVAEARKQQKEGNDPIASQKAAMAEEEHAEEDQHPITTSQQVAKAAPIIKFSNRRESAEEHQDQLNDLQLGVEAPDQEEQEWIDEEAADHVVDSSSGGHSTHLKRVGRPSRTGSPPPPQAPPEGWTELVNLNNVGSRARARGQSGQSDDESSESQGDAPEHHLSRPTNRRKTKKSVKMVPDSGWLNKDGGDKRGTVARLGMQRPSNQHRKVSPRSMRASGMLPGEGGSVSLDADPEFKQQLQELEKRAAAAAELRGVSRGSKGVLGMPTDRKLSTGSVEGFVSNVSTFNVFADGSDKAGSDVDRTFRVALIAQQDALGKGNVTFWQYSPSNGMRIKTRLTPHADSRQTDIIINIGEIFRVVEEVPGDGCLWLKLDRERGWLMDFKPGVGDMCKRQDGLKLWKYCPANGKRIKTRVKPDANSKTTENVLEVDDIFSVCEERRGADGVLYLKRENNLGWLFDHKPGVGQMCSRQECLDNFLNTFSVWEASQPEAGAQPKRLLCRRCGQHFDGYGIVCQDCRLRASQIVPLP